MGRKIDWADIKDRVCAIFSPERCLFCGEVVDYDTLYCEKCVVEQYGQIDCGGFPQGFAAVLAGAEYAGEIKRLLLKIKETPDRRILRFFAELMYREIRQNWTDIAFDCLVPVPASAEKLEQRGFNQAEMLAAGLSKLLSVPVLPDALIRYDDSWVQHSLNKSGRRFNAEKSYGPGNASGIAGKSVLLVDDVLTTGATLAACSDKLIQAGAKRVYAVTATAVRLREDARPPEIPGK